MNELEKMMELTKSVAHAMNLYPNDKAAIAYAIESQGLIDVYLDKETTFKKRKELLINWMMKPNHDIHFETINDKFSITLVEGKYDFCYIFHSPTQTVELASEVMEEVKNCKAEIAKMKESKKVVKVVEEVNVDALKNTINTLRDRNGELIGMVSKKSNEVKVANDEIASLKTMLALAYEKIASLEKDNEELAIYKEMVEEETKIAA